MLKKSIELQPDNPQAYKALGDLYLSEDQYTEAIANYRMAVVQLDDFADAHLGLGRALEAVGHLTEAEEALQRALYHDPDSPVVLYRLGQLYMLKNDTGRARAYYEMAKEKAAGDVEMESTIRNAIKDLPENE
jgi:tetratricopeptide (TPR) repeat protein